MKNLVKNKILYLAIAILNIGISHLTAKASAERAQPASATHPCYSGEEVLTALQARGWTTVDSWRTHTQRGKVDIEMLINGQKMATIMTGQPPNLQTAITHVVYKSESTNIINKSFYICDYTLLANGNPIGTLSLQMFPSDIAG